MSSADSLSARGVVFALRYGPADAAQPAASSGDRWLGRDKVKHAAASFLWTLSTQYVLAAKAEWSERDALPVSLASGAAVGLAKELYDRRRGPADHFCYRDLAADAVGLALAAGVILL